jgi:hypothetical protein
MLVGIHVPSSGDMQLLAQIVSANIWCWWSNEIAPTLLPGNYAGQQRILTWLGCHAGHWHIPVKSKRRSSVIAGWKHQDSFLKGATGWGTLAWCGHMMPGCITSGGAVEFAEAALLLRWRNTQCGR